jgi:hypothetical protein
MVIANKVFNTYLLSLLLLCLASGCQSPERKAARRLTLLNIHLESRDLPDREERISVSRSHPFFVSIQKAAFLTQNDVEHAEVIDVMGGFEIRLKFTREAAMMLEQSSSGNPGKHLALFSQFVQPPDEKLNEGRWLAAPTITRRISDGILVFTPDATREEADEIVRGLNNVAKKLKSSW